LSGFTRYELSFTPTSDGAAHDPVEVSGGNATVSGLAAGTYTLTAAGYAGTGDGAAVAAVGTAEGVEVSQGAATPVSIILGPNTGAAGTGSFGYDITVPPGVTSARLVITTQAGAAVSGGTVTLTEGGNTGTVPLAPGYYKLKAELIKGTEYTGFNGEALHIYAGLTSSLEPRAYTDGHFTKIERVTGITGVPAGGFAGVDLTLSGTVEPANATFTDILWSVTNPGMTGASISGNTLSTTNTGTVTVTAKGAVRQV
jgi:hypothetical protein